MVWLQTGPIQKPAHHKPFLEATHGLAWLRSKPRYPSSSSSNSRRRQCYGDEGCDGALMVVRVGVAVMLLRKDVKQSATIFRRNMCHIRNWLEESAAAAAK